MSLDDRQQRGSCSPCGVRRLLLRIRWARASLPADSKSRGVIERGNARLKRCLHRYRYLPLSTILAAMGMTASRKWRVMGRDTFAREDFVAGLFDTEKEAHDFVRSKKTSIEKTQDEGVRDEYWILPPKD